MASFSLAVVSGKRNPAYYLERPVGHALYRDRKRITCVESNNLEAQQ